MVATVDSKVGSNPTRYFQNLFFDIENRVCMGGNMLLSVRRNNAGASVAQVRQSASQSLPSTRID